MPQARISPKLFRVDTVDLHSGFTSICDRQEYILCFYIGNLNNFLLHNTSLSNSVFFIAFSSFFWFAR